MLIKLTPKIARMSAEPASASAPPAEPAPPSSAENTQPPVEPQQPATTDHPPDDQNSKKVAAKPAPKAKPEIIYDPTLATLQ